jgi:hypothetical protein
METKPMIITNKSGLIYRPEGIHLMLGHTRHFIRCGQEKLAEYQREAARARAIAPEGIPQEESIITDMQRELSSAAAIEADLQNAEGHIIHVYDRNFEMWAEAFRQARIQLGLAKIEDSPHLYAISHCYEDAQGREPMV